MISDPVESLSLVNVQGIRYSPSTICPRSSTVGAVRSTARLSFFPDGGIREELSGPVDGNCFPVPAPTPVIGRCPFPAFAMRISPPFLRVYRINSLY